MTNLGHCLDYKNIKYPDFPIHLLLHALAEVGTLWVLLFTDGILLLFKECNIKKKNFKAFLPCYLTETR